MVLLFFQSNKGIIANDEAFAANVMEKYCNCLVGECNV